MEKAIVALQNQARLSFLRCLWASLVLFLAGCAASQPSPDAPRVIGHRGSPGYDAENTIKGFIRAIELGADGVEIDLVVSSDGHLVVLHDWTLNRLVGTEQLESRFPERARLEGKRRTWHTRDFTRAELETLTVTQKGPQHRRLEATPANTAHRRIPSYQSFLSTFRVIRARRPDIILYTEIKTHAAHASEEELERVADAVVQVLREAGELDHPENHWLQSFDARVMEHLAARPELEGFEKGALLGSRPGFQVGPNPVVLDIDTIHTGADLRRFLQREVVDRGLTIVHAWKLVWYHLIVEKGIDCASVAHALGLQLHAFTFRDARFGTDYQNQPVLVPTPPTFASAEEEVRFFLEHGVDAVMSDTVTSALSPGR